MTYFQAIILGIVEGITEFLPISSTAHLIVAGKLLNLKGSAVKSFDIVIQFGAILAVIGLYRQKLMSMFQGLRGRDEEGFNLFLQIFVASLPIAFIGIYFKEKIQNDFFTINIIAMNFAIGGIIMLLIENYYIKKPIFSNEKVLISQAFFIGCIQCFALFPGTSRSFATIVGAMLFGMDRKRATEFSFLLALPVLGGACLIGFLKDYLVLSSEIGLDKVFIGIIVSAIVAMLTVKSLMTFLRRFGFKAFGIYRLVFAFLLYFFVIKKF